MSLDLPWGQSGCGWYQGYYRIMTLADDPKLVMISELSPTLHMTF